MSRLRGLGRSIVGKKAIMAGSGLLLFGFVVAHMVGNLQIFAGRDRLDAYARDLRAAPFLLWSIRAVLASAFAVHVLLALQLTAGKRAARPTGYHVRARDRWVARTMLWSGAVIGVFVVIHLANLTWGLLHPHFVPLAVYDNVIALFHVAPWSAPYVLALFALGAHVAHGLWSAPTSLGLVSERGAPYLRRLARCAAVVVATGMLAVVLAAAMGSAGGCRPRPARASRAACRQMGRVPGFHAARESGEPPSLRHHRCRVRAGGCRGRRVAGRARLRSDVPVFPGQPAASAQRRRAGRHKRRQKLSERRR